MRKIYLINLSFGLAGIERRFANLCQVLNRRGKFQAVLVIPTSLARLLEKANLLPKEPEALIVISEPRMSQWLGRFPESSLVEIIRSRLTARHFRKVWQNIKTDSKAILHMGLSCSALKPPDVPAVYECVDAGLQCFGRRHFRRASHRRLIVHCQTRRIQNALDAYYQNKYPRWQTVTNPVCFAKYDEVMPASDREPGLVAFVGRFSPEKNPLLFIEAIALARMSGLNCRAVMLGEGPMKGEVESFIKKLNLQEFISTQFHPRPTSIVNRAQIYVSFQSGDNYPSQALLEAMGAGCAIVASDVGETRNIVTEDLGVCVPLSSAALAAAIVDLLKSPTRLKKMGETARQIARSKYSEDNYAGFLESVYERAVSYHSSSKGAN